MHRALLVHHLLTLARVQPVNPLALHLCVPPSELQLLLCGLGKLFGEEIEPSDDLAQQSHHDAAIAPRQLLTRFHRVILPHWPRR